MHPSGRGGGVEGEGANEEGGRALARPQAVLADVQDVHVAERSGLDEVW